MRKRLFGLTAIGMTSFSALKRGPECSEPSGCSVYIPISPSSALETYTNVAASAGTPETMASRTAMMATFIWASPLVCSREPVFLSYRPVRCRGEPGVGLRPFKPKEYHTAVRHETAALRDFGPRL